MKELRVGIVGVGFIGGRHIDAISRIPNVKVVAIADAAVDRARQIAQTIGAEMVCETVDEMLEKGDVDVVHNCTPTNMHFDVSKKVLMADKHLYCEKPLALTSQEAEQMLELLQKHTVANGVNLNYRMNAPVQEIHARICSGEAGRPLMVTGSYIQDWMLRQDDFDWRLDPAIGGRSRAIADIGSHLFDTSQFVLGKRIVAVNASTLIAYPTRKQYAKRGGTFAKEKGEFLRDVAVCNEDAAVIMARFSDGMQGVFQVSQIAAGHKNDMTLRFDMTDCSFEWKQENCDQIFIGHRDEPNQVMYRESSALHPSARLYSGLPSGHPEGWNDTLLNAIRAFYDSITQGTYQSQSTPYATLADGAWIMKIIEACLVSDEKKCWVDVASGSPIQK